MTMNKLVVKKHTDGRYWLEDKKGVYDGPFQIRSIAQAIADHLNKTNA